MREWNYVADVAHARYGQYQALEAQAEARVRRGAEAAGVKVPVEVGGGYVHLGHAGGEVGVVFLALRATDDFADARK